MCSKSDISWLGAAQHARIIELPFVVQKLLVFPGFGHTGGYVPRLDASFIQNTGERLVQARVDPSTQGPSVQQRRFG